MCVELLVAPTPRQLSNPPENHNYFPQQALNTIDLPKKFARVRYATNRREIWYEMLLLYTTY